MRMWGYILTHGLRREARRLLALCFIGLLALCCIDIGDIDVERWRTREDDTAGIYIYGFVVRSAQEEKGSSNVAFRQFVSIYVLTNMIIEVAEEEYSKEIRPNYRGRTKRQINFRAVELHQHLCEVPGASLTRSIDWTPRSSLLVIRLPQISLLYFTSLRRYIRGCNLFQSFYHVFSPKHNPNSICFFQS